MNVSLDAVRKKTMDKITVGLIASCPKLLRRTNGNPPEITCTETYMGQVKYVVTHLERVVQNRLARKNHGGELPVIHGIHRRPGFLLFDTSYFDEALRIEMAKLTHKANIGLTAINRKR